MIDLGKYKGLPVFWKSQNGKCIIVYDRDAFANKYKLYLNEKYIDSSDSLGALVEIAKESYFYRR